MDITRLLAQMGGLQSIARELGISETQARSGAEALAPAILGGFKKQTQSQPSGLEGIAGLLGRLGGGGLLEEVLAPQPTNLDHGNAVLGEIFRSKDVSRAVAQNAAAKTGLEPSLLKKMLPMLAMLITGSLAKQQGDRAGAATQPPAGVGGLLSGMLGGQTGHAGAAPDAPAAGLASMLDLDGNGNPLDDILRMAGKALR